MKKLAQILQEVNEQKQVLNSENVTLKPTVFCSPHCSCFITENVSVIQSKAQHLLVTCIMVAGLFLGIQKPMRRIKSCFTVSMIFYRRGNAFKFKKKKQNQQLLLLNSLESRIQIRWRYSNISPTSVRAEGITSFWSVIYT